VWRLVSGADADNQPAFDVSNDTHANTANRDTNGDNSR
jgi:hypothetical protein